MTPDTRVFSLFNFPVYLFIPFVFSLNILQSIKIKFDLIYLSVSITWISSTVFLNLKNRIFACSFTNTAFQASCINLCNLAVWDRTPEFSFLIDNDKTFVLSATSSKIQLFPRVHRKHREGTMIDTQAFQITPVKVAIAALNFFILCCSSVSWSAENLDPDLIFYQSRGGLGLYYFEIHCSRVSNLD